MMLTSRPAARPACAPRLVQLPAAAQYARVREGRGLGAFVTATPEDQRPSPVSMANMLCSSKQSTWGATFTLMWQSTS